MQLVGSIGLLSVMSTNALRTIASFAFSGRAGAYTARKERTLQGNGYWYAYRRDGKRVRKKYLGKSETMTVERLEHVASRLHERLHVALSRPLTLVSASAGSGKSTLLSSWLLQQEEFITGWITLERGDNEPGRLWGLIFTVFEQLCPGAGAGPLALLRTLQEPECEGLLTMLLNQLATSQREMILVLVAALMGMGMNLGLTKMEQSCPYTYRQLAWSVDWHIREETRLSALACLDNFVLSAPLSRHWGDGTTSSSDGMRLSVGVKAANAEHNAKYFGAGRGANLYSHAADIWMPIGRAANHWHERGGALCDRCVVSS